MSVGLFKQVRVLAPVVPERLADDDGQAEPELVSLLADAGDGDAVGAELSVDARGHLRGLRLVRHGAKVRRELYTWARTRVARTYTPEYAGTTHLPHLISANPSLAVVSAGISAARKKDA